MCCGGQPDLRSMEYELKFTSGATTHNRADHELVVLAAVIGFGLYPQVIISQCTRACVFECGMEIMWQIAIPDDSNQAKDESEAVFHTPSRSQVPLHPSSALFRSPVRFHHQREVTPCK